MISQQDVYEFVRSLMPNMHHIFVMSVWEGLYAVEVWEHATDTEPVRFFVADGEYRVLPIFTEDS